MRIKTRIYLLVAAVVIALLVEVVGRVSGEGKTLARVEAALNTNAFIVDHVGSPITVADKEGPSRICLDWISGRRHGFYSVRLAGPTGEESLKVYWCELAGNNAEVYAICRTKPWAQDKLVWGAFRRELD